MQYIPQAAPFIMVDEIISTNDQETITEFYIDQHNIFVEDDEFLEPGLIENMAQTAASGTGYEAVQNGAQAPVGFIGQIKNLEIFSLPKVGQTIRTTIKNTNKIMNAFLIEGKIECDGEILAKGEYWIFLQH